MDFPWRRSQSSRGPGGRRSSSGFLGLSPAPQSLQKRRSSAVTMVTPPPGLLHTSNSTSRLGKLFSRGRSNSIDMMLGDAAVVMPTATKDAEGKKVYQCQVILILPLGDKCVVTGENGQNIGDVVDTVAMEHRLTSYRLHLAASKALLGLDTDISCLHGNEILVTENDLGDDACDGRLDLVRTLLRREKLYQECLHSIFEVYAEPLRKFSSLSAEDHRTLFLSLEPILSLSTSLCIKLSETILTWDPGTSPIGNLFSKQLFHHYQEYYSSYGTRRLLVKHKRQVDDEFAQFCRLRHGAAKHSLDSLLLLPVQRVPDYDVFLSRLLEDTDRAHPDYDDLKRAATRVRCMMKEREDEIKHVRNEQKMDAVQERFPNDDLHLQERDRKTSKPAARRRSGAGAVILKSLRKHGEKNSPNHNHLPVPDTTDGSEIPVTNLHSNCTHNNRIYVLESPVQFTTACQTQDRYLFLFNDLLLVAKQRSTNIFKLKHRVRVREMWLADCLDQVAETARPPERSFVLGWPTTNCVATFSSPNLMEVWREKLSSQICLEKEKEDPSCVVKIRYTDPGSNCQLMIKSLNVANDELVSSLLCRCIEEFHIQDKDPENYQLWSGSHNKDEPPYPLFGHEHPYSIRKSQERDWCQDVGEEPGKLDTLRGLDLSSFSLQTSKKKPRDLSLDDSKRNKKVKRSPLHNIFNKKNQKNTPAPPSGKLFGHPLTSVCCDDEIPEPIKEVLYILFREGLFTSGVFRKPGSHKKLQDVKSKMDSGDDYNREELTVPVAASLLKDFLKNLPNCLLDCDLFDQWTATSQTADNSHRIALSRKLIESLPKCHQNLLQHLMCVLYLISWAQSSKDQGMDGYALAVCIGQSLLWAPGSRALAGNHGNVSQSQADAANKVPPVIQFLIENCQEVFGEACLKLFGDLPQSTPEGAPGAGNRDNSSLDSLDRDCYYPEMECSPQLGKSHLSPTNLSRDSGLTLSDTQLYEDGTESEHSSIPPRKQSISRSYSQFEDSKPSADPGPLSSSHDGSLHTVHRAAPIPPPRKAKRRSAGMELENAMKASHGVPHLTTSVSAYAISDMSKRHSMYATKRVSDDSNLGSLDEEYPSELSELNVEHYRNQSDMGTICKSPSGAHLYLNGESMAAQPGQHLRSTNKDKRRSAPPHLFEVQPTDLSKTGPQTAHRGNLYKLGGSLDLPPRSSPSVPIPENQVLSLSSSYPNGALPSRPIFVLTPSDKPITESENERVDPSPSVSVNTNSSNVTKSSAAHTEATPYTKDYTPRAESDHSSSAYKVQMRDKSGMSGSSLDRGRKARLMRSDAIDSTVLRKTLPPSDDRLSVVEDGKLRKGMTASGADKFPKTIPLRTSLYSLDDMVKVESNNMSAQKNTPSHSSPGNKHGSSCRRSDSYSGGAPSAADRLRQGQIEKSASDISVSGHFDLSGPVRATGHVRPDKPPSYEEAIHRKHKHDTGKGQKVVVEEVVAVQQQNSAKAKKLYEESLQKYEVQKDGRCCDSHESKPDIPQSHSPQMPRRHQQMSPTQQHQGVRRSQSKERHQRSMSRDRYDRHQSPSRDQLELRIHDNPIIRKELPTYEQACQRAAQIKERREEENHRVLSSHHATAYNVQQRSKTPNHRSPESANRTAANHRSPESANRAASNQRSPESAHRAAANQRTPEPEARRAVDRRSPESVGRHPVEHMSRSQDKSHQRRPNIHSSKEKKLAVHAGKLSVQSTNQNYTQRPTPRQDTKATDLAEIMDRHQALFRQSLESLHRESPLTGSSSFSSHGSRESTPTRTEKPQTQNDQSVTRREIPPDKSTVISRTDSERSNPRTREGTPTDSDHSSRHRKEHKRLASRSRERRPGQRYSDPKISSTKTAMITNLNRSKSDSQEHLDKVGKFKELKAFENNKENVNIENVHKGQRSNRSTPERKASDERIKLHTTDRGHRRSIPEAVLKAAAMELQKDPEMDTRVRRMSIPSVRDRDWHKELASQYTESDMFYKPDRSPASLAQHGYTKDLQSGGDKPRRKWSPPVHPTKDLVYTATNTSKNSSPARSGSGVSRTGSGVSHKSSASLRTSGTSSPRDGGSKGPQSHRQSERPDDLERLHKVNQPKSESYQNSNMGRKQPATNQARGFSEPREMSNNPHSTQRGGSEPRDVCNNHINQTFTDSQGINWSVSELRNIYADQKPQRANPQLQPEKSQTTQPKSESVTPSNNTIVIKKQDRLQFYIPGSQPPGPVSRHNPPWRSTRTPKERTNPNADEAYI